MSVFLLKNGKAPGEKSWTYAFWLRAFRIEF